MNQLKAKLKAAAIPVLTALGVFALSFSLTGCNDEWNRWAAVCVAEGGHPAMTHDGVWSDRYECFKGDKIIVLSGYEGE